METLFSPKCLGAETAIIGEKEPVKEFNRRLACQMGVLKESLRPHWKGP